MRNAPRISVLRRLHSAFSYRLWINTIHCRTVLHVQDQRYGVCPSELRNCGHVHIRRTAARVQHLHSPPIKFWPIRMRRGSGSGLADSDDLSHIPGTLATTLRDRRFRNGKTEIQGRLEYFRSASIRFESPTTVHPICIPAPFSRGSPFSWSSEAFISLMHLSELSWKSSQILGLWVDYLLPDHEQRRYSQWDVRASCHVSAGICGTTQWVQCRNHRHLKASNNRTFTVCLLARKLGRPNGRRPPGVSNKSPLESVHYCI